MPFGSLAQLALGIGGQIASNRSRSSSRNDPSRAAEAQLATIPGAARPYYDPFIQHGGRAANRAEVFNQRYQDLYAPPPGSNPNALQNEYEQMAHNPTAFMDALMRGYNPSEGYRFKQQQMLDAMRNSASAGGFAGTPFNQQQQAETVQGLLGSDMQQYLQNALGIKNAGILGKENRISGMERALQSTLGTEEANMQRGYNASSALADILANVQGSRATNEFYGAQRRGNNAQSNIQGWQEIGNRLQGSGQNLFGPAMLGMNPNANVLWGGASRGFTPQTGQYGNYQPPAGSGNGSYF